ncbi:MAG TPA: protease modulator HflC [Oscillospiraceae bacterium]|nr:protease modulator HflC [Oscillospiraceae bacterium]HNW04430.1 protease modulator HflC [Oscillospiraceae bacterium]HPW00477.1 protease modulator HflC [Oscillospiraceae bacterium]
MEETNRPAAAKKSGRLAGKILTIALLLAAVIGLSESVYIVRANEYGVIREFGAVVDVRDQPGLYFKTPFIQKTSLLPKTVLLYDLPVSDLISADKSSLIADCFAIWSIDDPRLFIETLSGSIENAESRIDANVYNALKTVMSSLTLEQIISGRNGAVAGAIMANIGDSFEKYGIEMIAVETKKIDLPDDNKSAVYARMISERNNIAASYEAEGAAQAKQIRNAADKRVQITLAEASAQGETTKAAGDAEYMRILSEIYDTPEEADFYTFMIALDAMKESMTGEEKTLVLDADSPIAQIFYQ